MILTIAQKKVPNPLAGFGKNIALDHKELLK